jgi:HSP20 family molecular chaperone IbpA
VIIRGERKRTEEIKQESYYRAEASYGAFERHVPVPKQTTENDIEATYAKGVLEVVARGTVTRSG